MSFYRTVFAISTIALLVGTMSLADDTGTVSIVGRNVDSSDEKAFGLTLVLSNKTWTEAETGNATHFFKTKKGAYVQVNNVVSLQDSNRKEVGRINNLVPESAKRGDNGQGHAEETGITFDWEVK